MVLDKNSTRRDSVSNHSLDNSELAPYRIPATSRRHHWRGWGERLLNSENDAPYIIPTGSRGSTRDQNVSQGQHSFPLHKLHVGSVQQPHVHTGMNSFSKHVSEIRPHDTDTGSSDYSADSVPLPSRPPSNTTTLDNIPLPSRPP